MFFSAYFTRLLKQIICFTFKKYFSKKTLFYYTAYIISLIFLSLFYNQVLDNHIHVPRCSEPGSHMQRQQGPAMQYQYCNSSKSPGDCKGLGRGCCIVCVQWQSSTVWAYQYFARLNAVIMFRVPKFVLGSGPDTD